MKEISDGNLYTANDMVKADCQDCKGCSACCRGMGDSIVLDPYDVWQMSAGLGETFEELMKGKIALGVVDGMILPHLDMDDGTLGCPFLNEAGRCKIHAFRPGICRLFPLGRFYEEDGFKYFLQIHECQKKDRTKIKVKKWLGIANLKAYENYITSWHAFLKNCETALADLSAEEAKILQIFILRTFYQTPYQAELAAGDAFYSEYEKRRELVRMKLNSIQRMEVTYGRISQGEILASVLHSDIEKIKLTMEAIDHEAFEMAVDTILKAKRIYVIGIRSCSPLASFLSFYLNLICENVTAVNTNSSSEIFEQLIRVSEDDVVIGISFPRYSMRTLKALEFASNRKATVITLTDSVHSPMTLYSSCNLIARSDMASIVDSLVAPLSVINALVVALCMKKQKEVITTLETLEQIWDEYQVYSKDELNMVDDRVELSGNEKE